MSSQREFLTTPTASRGTSLRLIAQPLAPLLLSEPQSFTVAAVFRQAVYLVSSTDWVSVVLPGASLPPDGLQIDGLSDLRLLFQPGMSVTLGKSVLQTPGGSAFQTTNRTRYWKPDLRLTQPIRRSLQWNQSVWAWLARSRPQPDPSTEAILLRALFLFDHLIGELAKGDLGGIERSSCTLAGLGPGLTPLGDDLLLGAALALTVAAWHWPQKQNWTHLRHALIQPALSRTTPRSAAWLFHASQSRFSRELHALVHATLHDHPRCLAPIMTKVLQIGSTSGWATSYAYAKVLDHLRRLDE